MPVSFGTLPSQPLRGDCGRQGDALQPVQWPGAPRLHVHRYRFLGYFPLPFPSCESRIPFYGREDAGRPPEHISRERLLPRVGESWPSRMHGRKQLGISGGRRVPQECDQGGCSEDVRRPPERSQQRSSSRFIDRKTRIPVL